MNADQTMTDENAEIIQEFIFESHDMIDQLEPTIIELGQSCQNCDCWEILNCEATECSRHGESIVTPCWMHTGYINNGSGVCIQCKNDQDCLSCKVFHLTNGDVDTINSIFRLFHSMKGSAGFLELHNITNAAHTAENLLDLIRSGKIKMEPEHIDLLCQSCDFSKNALSYVASNYSDHGLTEEASAISDKLRNAIQAARAKAETAVLDKSPATPQQEEAKIETVEMVISNEMTEVFILEADELLQQIEQDLMDWQKSPDDSELIDNLFRNIHSFKGNCGFFSYADPESLSHAIENLFDNLRQGTLTATVEQTELLLTMVDVLKDGISNIAEGGTGAIKDVELHKTRILALLDCKSPESRPENVSKPVVTAQPEEKIRPDKPRSGQSPPQRGRKNAKIDKRRNNIRVDLEKLDNLINIIGELVIAENMVINSPDLITLELEQFNKASQQLSKLVRELQEMAMSIRMIPVSGLFRRMIRLVHDISVKTGKTADLQLSGQETELDKTVIEIITDPLVHLLRNAMDHGIESPGERLAAGKPEKGVIMLSARHEEGEIWITIEDDGHGLDRDKILAKAISKGIISQEEKEGGLPDHAVFNLIFTPGFSMAPEITDISGRGVGMDVVKQNLEKIKGKIEISSKLGAGTRIDLRIPLTLAIIEGMLVRSDTTKYIIPLLAIRDIFCLEPKAVTVTPSGQELVKLRGKFFPIVRLQRLFTKSMEQHNQTEGVLLLVKHQRDGICLFVDEILGQQQTVIKGLSNYINNAHSVTGCTILGDGEVCLILDVGSLVEIGNKRPEYSQYETAGG